MLSVAILLRTFLVISSLTYGTFMNANPNVDARNHNEIRIKEGKSGIFVGSSAHLELWIFYSLMHKKHLAHKLGVKEYLEKFVEKVNAIFETQAKILNVKFTLAGSRLWNEEHRALSPDMQSLDAELLKEILKVYAGREEKQWKKQHPHRHIAAFLYLTPKQIKDMDENNKIVSGVSGQIGGICVKDEKVAAVTDSPGKYTGVRSAARQLSRLMGAVYDGEEPPPQELVPGSDGAQDCSYSDGYLMGKEDVNGEKSLKLSDCSSYQHIMGLRNRGPGCYGTSTEKESLSNFIEK
uniref:Putative secreted metalloprotease n=2 Tax=Ixodes ricinus TaxID=34613 RepID=A0A090X851_IXORI